VRCDTGVERLGAAATEAPGLTQALPWFQAEQKTREPDDLVLP